MVRIWRSGACKTGVWRTHGNGIDNSTGLQTEGGKDRQDGRTAGRVCTALRLLFPASSCWNEAGLRAMICLEPASAHLQQWAWDKSAGQFVTLEGPRPLKMSGHDLAKKHSPLAALQSFWSLGRARGHELTRDAGGDVCQTSGTELRGRPGLSALVQFSASLVPALVLPRTQQSWVAFGPLGIVSTSLPGPPKPSLDRHRHPLANGSRADPDPCRPEARATPEQPSRSSEAPRSRVCRRLSVGYGGYLPSRAPASPIFLACPRSPRPNPSFPSLDLSMILGPFPGRGSEGDGFFAFRCSSRLCQS